MPLKVLGVGSSMRKDSFSTETLKIILDKVNKNDGDTRLLNLYSNPVPMYTAEFNEKLGGIKHAVELVNWADAIILATPDYHGSMAGSLKNFLDYFWAEFAGKTFGYLCSSHEKGLTVMDQMRTAIRQCYGWSLPYGISINSSQDFNKDREIINERLLGRLESFARDLVVYGSLISNQFKKDLNSTIQNSYAVHYRK
ncbi:NADPH-dependent FMN reductase [Candidatus Nitrosocosmicus arcticus]|uniref:NADH-dependent FMN reductase n=1 Tax=Candidatus Nitrosocosmicus arcticus TaxID=2035267 RepID=A0A557SUU7_9ARCH|nr:NAD(P)H-dependent oxidoreductase [Candidatus Nitrosocosmicus arcticus]TVP40384.1 NADH-dependent FMN reductase [Candidatus Nitrosocosmicus arcticus]